MKISDKNQADTSSKLWTYWFLLCKNLYISTKSSNISTNSKITRKFLCSKDVISFNIISGRKKKKEKHWDAEGKGKKMFVLKWNKIWEKQIETEIVVKEKKERKKERKKK